MWTGKPGGSNNEVQAHFPQVLWLRCVRVCTPEHPGVLSVPGCTWVRHTECCSAPGCAQVYDLSSIVQHYAPPTNICEHHEKFQPDHAMVSLCTCRCAQVWRVCFGGLGCALVHLSAPRWAFFTWVWLGSFVHDSGSLGCAPWVGRRSFPPSWEIKSPLGWTWIHFLLKSGFVGSCSNVSHWCCWNW